MPMNWGSYNDADLGKAWTDYQRRTQYRPGYTGRIDPNDPDWVALNQEYQRRVGARSPGQYQNPGAQPPAGSVPGTGGSWTDQIKDWMRQWRNQDPVYRAGQDLPGEQAYYDRQIGSVQRALGAQRDSAAMNLGQALAARGMGGSSVASDAYANLSRGYGQQLGQALGDIENSRFAAREQRIQRAQDRQFQDQQARKNFEYQLALLKTQLASQGRSDVLSYIDSLAGSLFESLFPGDGANIDAGAGVQAPDEIGNGTDQWWNT